MGEFQDLDRQIRSIQAEIAMQQTQIKMNLMTSAMLMQTAVLPATFPGAQMQQTHGMSIDYKARTTATRPRLLNCPNCGAPVTGQKCEYCGTRFD